MTNDKLDPITDELVCDRYALLWVGHIVADAFGQLFAKHSAAGVELVDCRLNACPILFAIGGIRSRHRTGNSDHDVGVGSAERRG